MTSGSSSRRGNGVQWRTVYTGVVIYTLAVVALLSLFSQWFAG